MTDNTTSTPTSPYPIIFFGTPHFAVPVLESLLKDPRVVVRVVVTQPDRPAGRGARIRPSPIKALAAANGIPVLQPERIKKCLQEFLNESSAYGPFELGVVVSFGQILPQAVLDLPKQGCVNIHASLLPRWRGAAPIHRAIIAGDERTGICLMKMEAGLDTGPVYFREEVPIGPTDDTGSLHDALAKLGAEILVDNVDSLASGTAQATAQPEEGVTYADKISNEEALIDWYQNATIVARKVRGLNPFPGAYTTFSGKRLKILQSTPLMEPKRGEPGEVVFVDGHTLEVACGEGVVSLQELQLEGKKKLPVVEFLKGVSVSQGIVLGDKTSG